MKSFNLFGDSWSDSDKKSAKKSEKNVKKSSSPKPTPKIQKSETAYRTISEVAESMNIATHVLRFWETKFPEVQPMRRGGGRRYYRPEDVQILKRIQDLLHNEGYTIKGVQSLIKKDGVKSLLNMQSESTVKDENASVLDKSFILSELKSIRKMLDA